MIQDIEKTSNSFSFSNNVIVTEKMNMFYFKVIITPTSCNVISHNHKVITNIERVVNDVWEEVISFVNKEIEPKKEYITSKYGNLIIGFFYCPVIKPLVISYNKFFDTNISNNKFIISNIKRIEDKKFIDISSFCLDVKMLNIRGIGGGPIITYPEKFIEMLNSFTHKEISKEEFINYMENNMVTFSGNSFNNIEGIVIEDNSKKTQLIINNTIDNKEYDRKEYEMIIKHFIDYYINQKANIVYKDYTSYINDIFLDFISKTTLFKTIELNANNLIPPGGYIGDLNYKLIDNPNIKTICKVNDVYKNVYRILYKGLKKTKKFNPHLVILTEEDIQEWNKIVNSIWQ